MFKKETGLLGSSKTISTCFSLVLEVSPFTPRQDAAARLAPCWGPGKRPDLGPWSQSQGVRQFSFMSHLLSSNLLAKILVLKWLTFQFSSETSAWLAQRHLAGADWEWRPQGLGEQSRHGKEASRREKLMLYFPLKTRG